MKLLSKHLPASLSLALAALLSACASAPPNPGDAAPKTERQYQIGSRLPATSSTQIVRNIGSSEAQEAMRSRPPSGGPLSN